MKISKGFMPRDCANLTSKNSVDTNDSSEPGGCQNEQDSKCNHALGRAIFETSVASKNVPESRTHSIYQEETPTNANKQHP